MPRRQTDRFVNLSTARDRSGWKPRSDDDDSTEDEQQQDIDSASDSEYKERPEDRKRRQASSSGQKRNAKRAKASEAKAAPASPAGAPRTFNRPRLKFKVSKGKTVVEVVSGYKKDPLGLVDSREYTYLPSIAPDQAPFRADKPAQERLRDALQVTLNAAQLQLNDKEMSQAHNRSNVLAQLDEHATGPFEPFESPIPVMQAPETYHNTDKPRVFIIAAGSKHNLSYDPSNFITLNVSNDALLNLWNSRAPINQDDILGSQDVAFRDLSFHHAQAILQADAAYPERNAEVIDEPPLSPTPRPAIPPSVRFQEPATPVRGSH
ncbi:hypothetical protein JCM11641_003869 [Rhodosporidiobolus odoratus]